MSDCKLDGRVIRCEADLKGVILEVERRLGRPLPQSAIDILYSRFSRCFSKKEAEKHQFLSDEDQEILASGQGVEAMLKAKRARLRRAQKKRDREAMLYRSTHGEKVE